MHLLDLNIWVGVHRPLQLDGNASRRSSGAKGSCFWLVYKAGMHTQLTKLSRNCLGGVLFAIGKNIGSLFVAQVLQSLANKQSSE